MVCAFTGHRPERLPWGGDESDPRCLALKQLLLQAVLRACDDGYTTFLCGMARGCDCYFAEAVLAARVTFPAIQLVAMIPCPSQSSFWAEEDRQRHQALCGQCSRVVLHEPVYSPGCMLRRNRHMVSLCQRLITVYDGGRGGTGETVQYAISQGKDLDRLWY